MKSKKTKKTPAREQGKKEVKPRILDAYLTLAQEMSVSAITLQMVAKKAKVAFGTVHYHFAGKEMPLEEAAVEYIGLNAQSFIASYLENLGNTADSDPVSAYIRGTFQWALAHPTHASYWCHYYHLTSINTRFRQTNGLFLQKARQRVESLLYEGIGKKALPPVKDVQNLALKIHTLLIGGVMVGLIDPTPGALEAQQGLTIAMAGQLIHANNI